MAHLRDVGDALQLHLGGAGGVGRGGVQDLHRHADEQARPKGHALAQTLVQLLVLVHQRVGARGAVHVDPGGTQRGKEAWREVKKTQKECSRLKVGFQIRIRV